MATRLYSLFKRPRNATGRWERVSNYKFPKPEAIRFFQNDLISECLGEPRYPGCELQLRPVFKIDPPYISPAVDGY